MKMLARCCFVLATLALVSAWAGCGSGQPSGRPDLDAIPDEELHGASTKGMLYEFRAKVRKRGAAAAKAELPALLESFQDYEKQPVGKHKDIYREIAEKLKALE